MGWGGEGWSRKRGRGGGVIEIYWSDTARMRITKPTLASHSQGSEEAQRRERKRRGRVLLTGPGEDHPEVVRIRQWKLKSPWAY